MKKMNKIGMLILIVLFVLFYFIADFFLAKDNENRDTYFLISYEDLQKLDDKTHNFDKSIYKEAY